MIDYYKGFIETKNKKAIEKFKNRDNFKTYDEIKNIRSFAGVLGVNAILIDIDDKKQSNILLRIIKAKNISCIVRETNRGMHFLFENNEVESCKTSTMLTCGLIADIKVGSKNSYQVLKHEGKMREIIYGNMDTNIDIIPEFLFPIKSNINFLDSNTRNQTLFNYILILQRDGYTKDSIKSIINIINDYVLPESLDGNEIDTILRDEAFNKPNFFLKDRFLFDKFANFLKNNHHIIKINDKLHIYSDGIYVDDIYIIENKMIQYIPDLVSTRRIEVLKYLDISITKNTLLSNEKYIAFKNGIMNIDDGLFINFSPTIILKNKIPHDYNPEAESEIIENVLKKISCNHDGVYKLLEEVIGYCFYRRNELRKAFILVGDKSNGKSTFLDMIKNILGMDNISSLDLCELGDRFRTAELFGKLANIGDDIDDEFIPKTSLFRKISSGDIITVERKGGNPFKFNPYVKLIFSANDVPRMKDKTGAVLDRLILVPFNAKFSRDDFDFNPYIKYDLRTEIALERLIIIGIKGLKRVLTNRGFTKCNISDEALIEYNEINNPILVFFDTLNVCDVINQVTTVVYLKYTVFCNENGIRAVSNIEFSRKINKHFNSKIINKTVKNKKFRIFIRKE